MRLKELIDVSEGDLVICENGYDYPFLTIRQLEDNNSDDFKDVFSKEFLNREVDSFRIEGSLCGFIKVNLREVE